MMKKLFKKKGKRRFPIIFGILIGVLIGAIIIGCIFLDLLGEGVDEAFNFVDDLIRSPSP